MQGKNLNKHGLFDLQNLILIFHNLPPLNHQSTSNFVQMTFIQFLTTKKKIGSYNQKFKNHGALDAPYYSPFFLQSFQNIVEFCQNLST